MVSTVSRVGTGDKKSEDLKGGDKSNGEDEAIRGTKTMPAVFPTASLESA